MIPAPLLPGESYEVPADTSGLDTWAYVVCPDCATRIFTSKCAFGSDPRSVCKCGIFWRTKTVGVGVKQA